MVANDAFGEHLGVSQGLTSEEGRSWLASLPAAVAALEGEWQLRTASPYIRGTAAWTAPTRRSSNILSAARAPFPAIAPSRWSATRRTNPWPLVDQIDDRKANRDVLGRARFFAPLVDVPADRLLAGGVARSVESALWDVEEGRPANGEAAMRSARVLARLL